MFATISALVLHFAVGSAAHLFISGAVSGLVGGAAAMAGGDVLSWLMGLSWVQTLIGKSLNIWKGPGIALAKLLETGKLQNVAKFIVIPIVYIGFGFFTALDAFIGALPASTVAFMDPFLAALAKAGSKSRFTYLADKTTTAPVAPPPSPAGDLAAALATPTAPPDPVAAKLAADAGTAEIKAELTQ